MLSSSCNDGSFESPVDGDKEPTINSTSASAGSLIMASSEEAVGRSDETRVSGNIDDENRSGDANGGENQPSSSVSNSKNDGKVDNKKNKSIVEDYNSILSAFDEFAAENKGESVGHGYKIGDMVWGKVKSHPWWPGHIYNEALASPSVRRSKTEGHVLVAFFGDSSYGWFDPAELIPFEENFADKSRQTNLRSFTKAVEEALDELSRRSSLGLACRCRNQFNFWPSSVDGYFVVDVGDYERGIYGLSQINKARNDFRPRELLSFIHQLALAPMNSQHSSIDFIKDKATVLACRKAMFEEFDETYAQAFGTIPVRPSRPTAPVAMDPSKAPLRGRLVIAEALSKGKTFVKPTKTKDQMEKDKYLFKRRDEPIKTKSKKANSGRAVDESGFPEKHHTSESGVDYQNQASMASDIRPVERVNKKAKVQKRPAGELSAENAKLIEKRKKKKRDIMSETGEQLPVTVSNGAMASDIQKKDAVDVSSSSQSQQAVDFDKVELQMVVRDLRALALNPTHGHGRGCPSVIRQVFLKYRSLVYQKSLILSPPPPENEANEGNSSILPATTVSAQKINNKIIKPSARLDDPTRGGRKRAPSENPENIKKKKKTDGVAQEMKKKKKTDDVSQVIKIKKKTDEEIKKRKSDAIEEIRKKKKLDNSKLMKIPQRSSDSHLKESAANAKNVHAIKVESSKKMMQNVKGGANPTMLVMKFPEGAALPSGAELRAKFARFGPLDHSATRVFWKSYTCRLVYHHRIDAEAALNFANGSSNLFGNTNVRSYVREVGGAAEGAESEAIKPVQKEESDRIAAAAAQQIQNVEQLKSCLKKSEGGGRGGGMTRVKFVLESNIEGEKLHFSTSEISSNSNSNNKNKNIEVLDMNNKTNLPKLKSSINTEQGSSRFKQQPINDISQEMLNLLMRCSDLVNNLTGVLGYVPYHSL